MKEILHRSAISILPLFFYVSSAHNPFRNFIPLSSIRCLSLHDRFLLSSLLMQMCGTSLPRWRCCCPAVADCSSTEALPSDSTVCAAHLPSGVINRSSTSPPTRLAVYTQTTSASIDGSLVLASCNRLLRAPSCTISVTVPEFW